MSNTKKNKVRYNPFSGLGGAGELNKAEKIAGSVEEAAFLSPDRTGRLAAVMRKAASGDKVVICVLGGSITEGSGASDGEYYGDNLYAWFKQKFPDGDFEYHNVGRGTTTSLFGSARIERDLAPLKPDLIVVEYAVNDIILDDRIAAEAFECTLRKCLSLAEAPAVFCLFCCMGSLESAEHYEAPIAAHYGLPASSLSSAIRRSMRRDLGERLDMMSREEKEAYAVSHFIFDGCHPDTACYHMLADFIARHLESAAAAEYALPQPVTACRFMTAHIENNTALNVISDCGWEISDRDEPYIERGYVARTAGARIVFSFPRCRVLTLVTRRSIKPTYGIITISVDGGSPVRLDGYFRDGWGTHNDYRVIIDESEPADRTVEIVFTGEKTPEHIADCEKEGISPELAAGKFILSEFLTA